MTELVPLFEAENPGVRVRVQQIPWSAAHEKLLTAFVGRSTPDLAQVGNTWIPELAALGAVEDLRPRLTQSAGVDAADYFPGIWATNVVDGALYGLPWYVDTRVLFYRPSALRRVGLDGPPETWAQWREALVRLRDPARGHYGLFAPLNEWTLPVVLGMQAGSPLLREGGRYGAFRDGAFAEAFAFYVGLFREGLVVPPSGAPVHNVYQEFARGTFSMYVTGPWNLGEFRARLPDSLQNDWETAPMPGPDGLGTSTAGGSSLVLFRDGPRADAAWAFAAFLSRPEIQARFYEITGSLPARESAWEAGALAGDPHADAFRSQLRRAQPTPAVPEWERIAGLVMTYAERAARGAMTEDEALAALDAETDAVLDKRRWLLARTD